MTVSHTPSPTEANAQIIREEGEIETAIHAHAIARDRSEALLRGHRKLLAIKAKPTAEWTPQEAMLVDTFKSYKELFSHGVADPTGWNPSGGNLVKLLNKSLDAVGAGCAYPSWELTNDARKKAADAAAAKRKRQEELEDMAVANARKHLRSAYLYATTPVSEMPLKQKVFQRNDELSVTPSRPSTPPLVSAKKDGATFSPNAVKAGERGAIHPAAVTGAQPPKRKALTAIPIPGVNKKGCVNTYSLEAPPEVLSDDSDSDEPPLPVRALSYGDDGGGGGGGDVV
jgi:hypothetical protein